METQNQENKIGDDKTIILTIVPGGKDMILLFARANNVGYDTLGKDQNENDLIKFTYSKDQQETINSIGVYVKFIEAVMAGIKPIIEPVLQVLKEEAEKLGKEIKTVSVEKRKFPRFKSEPKNNKADGTETGKHAA
jgi:hypothetical protein